MVIIISRNNLNHGLAVSSNYLYASESTTVYRWPYDPATKSVTDSNNPQIGINNINADGQGGAPFGHTTRTLVLSRDGTVLYVSVGSNENIDADSVRSRIRYFPVDDSDAFPMDFFTCLLYSSDAADVLTRVLFVWSQLVLRLIRIL